MYRRYLFAALLASASVAHAGDKPLYGPAPGWVRPAPPIDPAKINDDSPIFLILDNQQRLQDGEVVNYVETAARVGSTQMLDALGTVTLPWQPDKGDLTIHKAEIIRGAEHIDLVAGGERFVVLRREEQLEQRTLNGILTATMAVEGLRVGDVLHMVFSTANKDPALNGNVQAFALLPADPFRAGYARVRFLWPEGKAVRWKASASGALPQLGGTNGYRELSVALPLPTQPEMPADAPARFRRTPILEATSFADWSSISKTMAPLYATDGAIAPGSPLAGEVARIAAAETDPVKRAALALRMVQEQVRYLFKGMDGGNYVPQSPTQTWARRYGDCKAKTLLLLAVLRGLGIEAEPVLANAELGDWVPERLPSPGAFNHVFVRATIAGESLWLDGTDGGTLLSDIRDTPPFRMVLPVRAAGAELMPLPMHPSARPEIAATLERDDSAGVDFPAPFTLALTLRGQVAQMMRAMQGQASKDQLTQMATKMGEPYVGSATIVARKLSVDAAAGTATLTMSGVMYPDWDRENERYRSTIDPGVSILTFAPDRSRAGWRDVPVTTGDPQHATLHTKIKLPDGGKGFTLDGTQNLSDTLAGVKIVRSAAIADGWMTSDMTMTSTGAEVPVAEIGATKLKLAQAKQHLLRIVAPADYPAAWQVVQAGRAGKRFEPLLAAYRQGVTDRPGEAVPFTNRAWFEEKVYDRKAAIEDLGRAIAIDPTADSYLWRGRLYRELGDRDKALTDMLAARKVDPASATAITDLAKLYADRGDKVKALALLDERIGEGGKDQADFISEKAEVLSKTGDKDTAMTVMDQAVAAKPGNPDLLNARCWLKGTMNVLLDTALKDCTKAIALSDSSAQVLDSRAMVYFRMNQFDDALADLNSALEQKPGLAASMYMRGVIRKRQGDSKAGDDLAAARLMAPTIDETYAKFGIVP